MVNGTHDVEMSRRVISGVVAAVAVVVLSACDPPFPRLVCVHEGGQPIVCVYQARPPAHR